MIENLIQEIAKWLGADPRLIEGGAVTVALIAMIRMAQVILAFIKTDAKQLTLEQRLVELAASSVEESRKLRLAYEDTSKQNIGVLEDLKNAFKDFGGVFSGGLKAAAGQTDSLKQAMIDHEASMATYATRISEQLDDIRSHILNKRPLVIVLRDETGQDVFSFTATIDGKTDETDRIVVTFKDLTTDKQIETKVEEVKS